MKYLVNRYERIQWEVRWNLVPKIKRILGVLRDAMLTPLTGGILLLTVGVFVTLYGHVRSHNQFNAAILFNELWGNIGTELGSIAITILLIDRLYKRQAALEEKRRQDSERHIKQSIFEYQLYQAKTSVEKEGILYEMNILGLLEGSNLARLDFSGIKLGRLKLGTMTDPIHPLPRHQLPSTISLKGANLADCNFTDADLTNVNMQNTQLGNAIFSNTIMDGVDLRNANIYYATIKSVSMKGANLQGLEFSRCHVSDLDLTSAKIEGLHFYRYAPNNVTLPNGNKLEYKSDLEEFDIRVMSHFQYPETRPITNHQKPFPD